jgi:hypothetical protein
MTAFLTLHRDEGGTMTVNLADIVSFGEAHGDATGSRVVIRDVGVFGCKDDVGRIADALEASGARLD